MITLDLFLLGLFIVSTATGLGTQAVKKFLSDFDITYKANVVASIVAVIVSILVGFGYVILNSIAITAPIVVYLVALTIGGWLCAMVGYDKVAGMFKNTNKEE